MKHQLITAIAAVVLVGCGEPQEAKDIQLRIAAKMGHIEGVKKAIAHGANVNAKDSSGTALNNVTAGIGHRLRLYEIKKNHIDEVVRLLISAGADVNIKGDYGDTPLHSAVEGGPTKTVELLIANGADVNAIDDDGNTPLDATADWNYLHAELLRKHGGNTGFWFKASESIHTAAKAGHIEAVKQHLLAGTNVNAKDNRGNTPLHNASNLGHNAVIRLLIAKGADVNAMYKDGETPLDWAIAGDETETINLLRKHGGKTSEELNAEGK
jgi:ankyrin repeat protein